MVSTKPWSLEATARLFIFIILSLFFGVFLAGSVETPKSPLSSEDRDFVEMILMTIFFHGAALVWVGVFLRQNHLKWKEAFFTRGKTWRAMAIGLAVGAVATPALLLLQEGLALFAKHFLHWNLEAEELVQKLGSPMISLAAKIFIGFTAVVIAPLAEEVIFRGVLYPTIKQMGFPRAAFFGVSILFALAHFSAMAFVPLALFSMILIWLYEACDNLAAPIMAHCALNTINYCMILATPATAAAAH